MEPGLYWINMPRQRSIAEEETNAPMRWTGWHIGRVYEKPLKNGSQFRVNWFYNSSETITEEKLKTWKFSGPILPPDDTP